VVDEPDQQQPWVSSPPQSFTIRYPDDQAGPYSLRIWTGYLAGSLDIVGIELWGVQPRNLPWRFEGDPDPREGMPDTRITAESVRLKIGELRDTWISLQGVVARMQEFDPERPNDMSPEKRSYLKDLRAPRPSGRRRRDPEHYRQVADVYMAAARAGSPPNKAVEKWAAKNGDFVKASTVRGWARQAEELGYLAKSPQGKVRRGKGTS
jgi:hypothetical protein